MKVRVLFRVFSLDLLALYSLEDYFKVKMIVYPSRESDIILAKALIEMAGENVD